MQGIAKKKHSKEHETSIIRVEANLEEWPLFSATKRSRREEIVVWRREGRDPVTSKPIEQTMTLRPARGLGLPGECERDIYYLVLGRTIEREGFGPKGRIGPIRFQDACQMLGWTRTGPNYEQIREALRTLASITVEFQHAIIDGRTRRLREIITSLFPKVEMYSEKEAERANEVGETYELKRGEFFLEAADWFIESWAANYVKPIDTAVYRALRTPLAKALFSYLDKRAYDGRRGQLRPEVTEDLFDLRERFRLGTRATKHLLEEFRRAHEDLQRAWPVLREARIEKVARGRYRARYVFSNQIELVLPPVTEATQEPKISEQTTPIPENRGETTSPELVKELMSRGVTSGVARRLVRSYPEDLIRRHLDIHDEELKTDAGIVNPGGRLHQRITEDWAPFGSYMTPDERKRTEERRRAEVAKRADEEKERRRERTPEERAAVQARRWAIREQLATGRSPNEDEIAAKRAEYLRERDPAQGAGEGLNQPSA